MQPDRMINDQINDLVNALLRARGLTLREQLQVLREAEDQLRELVERATNQAGGHQAGGQIQCPMCLRSYP